MWLFSPQTRHWVCATCDTENVSWRFDSRWDASKNPRIPGLQERYVYLSTSVYLWQYSRACDQFGSLTIWFPDNLQFAICTQVQGKLTMFHNFRESPLHKFIVNAYLLGCLWVLFTTSLLALHGTVIVSTKHNPILNEMNNPQLQNTRWSLRKRRGDWNPCLVPFRCVRRCGAYRLFLCHVGWPG